MPKDEKAFVILIAEDDEDDFFLTKDAFKEAGIKNKIIWVRNGEELMDYLLRRGSPGDENCFYRPAMILLDLNMPKMDGRETLAMIKSDPDLRRIPVTVLTTSKAQSDILHTYDLGVNSFIQKPVRFQQFVDTIKLFSKYWLNIVKLPE
ncbi:MAG: response regulator [Nitrospinales bacterium]